MPFHSRTAAAEEEEEEAAAAAAAEEEEEEKAVSWARWASGRCRYEAFFLSLFLFYIYVCTIRALVHSQI